MSQYRPDDSEREAIDMLQINGYHVMRRRTYEHMVAKLAHLQNEIDWTNRAADSARDWARDCRDEERRLADRLTMIAAGAREAGLPLSEILDVINATPRGERMGVAS